MEKIVGIFSNASSTRSNDDDDFADRLSSRYTVVLIIAFALVVGFKQVSCSNLTQLRSRCPLQSGHAN